MKVSVIGKGYLAQTIREVCEEFGHTQAMSMQADVVWLAEDVEVGDDHQANVNAIVNMAARHEMRADAIMVVSSQLPLGTTARIQATRKQRVICAPENIRRGHGREDMVGKPPIVGIDDDSWEPAMVRLFRWADDIVFMSIEAAEMSKHAINAHLASQIALTNEIGDLCAKYGVDAGDVERATRADGRCGAYLRVGEPFTGGTLARDLEYLKQLGAKQGLPLDVVAAIQTSNDRRLR